MNNKISIIAMVVLFGGCGVQDVSPSKEIPAEFGVRGKADGFVNKNITCEGECGSLVWDSLGYCGCDEQCDSYGDCCADKPQFCDAATSAIIIDKSLDGQTVVINMGDTVDVQLAGNPTTGYAWHLLNSSRSFPLQTEEYVPDQPILTGSGGTYHFTFVADMFSVGNTFELNFHYTRSWEGVDASIETFTVKIQVLPSISECLDLEQEYKDEVAQSQGCQIDAECQAFVGGSLSCGFPQIAINVAFEQEVKAFGDKWWNLKCHQQDWMCPLFSPLPPWFEVKGVCQAGACKVEYVDTRATEGDSCGEDIDVQCGEGLYCAFGLNWCGTPPFTGTCRQMGDCGAASDCYNERNDWIHPACMGEATCSEQGTCGWDCSNAPF